MALRLAKMYPHTKFEDSMSYSLGDMLQTRFRDGMTEQVTLYKWGIKIIYTLLIQINLHGALHFYSILSRLCEPRNKTNSGYLNVFSFNADPKKCRKLLQDLSAIFSNCIK